MSTKPPYQDQWIDGQLAVQGRRDCESRYQLIFPYLRDTGVRSLVDIGGWDGYFSHRVTLDFPHIDVLNVDRRKQPTHPVPHLQITVTADNISSVPDADAYLLFSVLHHLADWRPIVDNLRSRPTSPELFIELADPAEAERLNIRWPGAGTRAIDQATYLRSQPAEYLGSTTGPNKSQRPIYTLLAGR